MKDYTFRRNLPLSVGVPPLEESCECIDAKRASAEGPESAGFPGLPFAKQSALTGFTLVELMVSIAIFLFLGIMLISVFKSGMDLWNAGESRKIIYSRAQNILSVIKDDFVHMAVHDYSKENGEEVDIRLISDLVPDNAADPSYYAQRVRFVREEPFEMRDSVRSAGGANLIPDAAAKDGMYDHFNDSTEASAGTLRAAGGLSEIGYICKNEYLYRAINAPVGYKGNISGYLEPLSLFNSDLFFNLSDTVLFSHAEPLGKNILHFEVRFWCPKTESWEISESGRLDNEASYEWDSTRVPDNEYPFDEDLDDADPFTAGDQPAVPGDASDDIFPAKVKVILVVDSGMRTRAVTKYVNGNASVIDVTGTEGFTSSNTSNQYIRIGNEWVHYALVGDTSFSGVTRGVRHTVMKDHSPGDVIYQGVTFSMVIDIPGVEND